MTAHHPAPESNARLERIRIQDSLLLESHTLCTLTDQLIEAHCNIDVQAKVGSTPLYCAAQNGYAAVAQLLLTARCNIDLQAMNGLTEKTKRNSGRS